MQSIGEARTERKRIRIPVSAAPGLGTTFVVGQRLQVIARLGQNNQPCALILCTPPYKYTIKSALLNLSVAEITRSPCTLPDFPYINLVYGHNVSQSIFKVSLSLI